MDTKIFSGRATTWFVLCSIVAMLYFARDFVVPVAIAVFVAFVLSPMVRRLERFGLPRIGATIATVAVVGVLVGALGWLVVGQVRFFAENMPEYRANVRAKAADVRTTFGAPLQQATSTVRGLGNDLTNDAPVVEAPARVQADLPAATVIPTDEAWDLLPGALGSMAEFSAIFALVFLLAFLMLLRWEDLRDRMLALAGENDLQITTRAANEASAKVGLYLRRQLLINGVHGATMALLLWWIGVPTPLVWGLLGATLRFVPYLGPAVSTVAPILVSFGSSEGWEQTWITAGALIGLELITNNVLEPWLYASSTGISPFTLLVSTAFWTWIWGPMGLVLATPLSVCMLVAGKRFPSLRFLDIAFREEPALPQASRLYHRLIANDQYEAWEILRDEEARGSTVETADRALLPALGIAGRAHVESRIDDESRARIGVLAHTLVDELLECPRAPAKHPSAGALRVLSFPARDAFDDAASRLLVGELAKRGFPATSSAPERMLAEVLESIRRGEHDAVVISSVAPTHFLHVRSLCKRLLALDRRVEILVGLWSEEMSPAEARARLPESPHVHVATSIAQTIAWSEELSTRVATQRAPAQRAVSA